MWFGFYQNRITADVTALFPAKLYQPIPTPISPSAVCRVCLAAGVYCHQCYHFLFEKRKEVDSLDKHFLNMFSLSGYRSRLSCCWRAKTA